MDHLLATHFPNSVAIEREAPPAAAHCTKCLDWREVARVVTYGRVVWAINSFAPYKSPGMDEIFLSLLQEEQRLLVPSLVMIYHACLANGYIPAIWCQVEVVFIPKPDGNSFGRLKDFRLISLTSFLLKTMDRLVDKFLRDEILAFMLLHPNPHAYQAGQSVDTAFISSWCRLRRCLTNRIQLWVFS